MELRHLRYFVMAAEERNISRAATRLNISQPAVSRQIKDLEEELGVILFTRQRDGLALTDAGVTALAHANEMLRMEQALRDSVVAFRNAEVKTLLRIGFLPTALPGFLAGALRQFNQRYPDVCIELHEQSPRQQERELRKGKLDLALLGSACPKLKRDFHVEAIRKTPMALLLPDDHKLRNRKRIDLAELADEPFLSLHENQFPGREELMTDFFTRSGIQPDIVTKASSLTELLGLVAGGMGVAIAPEDLNRLPHPGVQFVELKRPRRTLTFSAAWHPENAPPVLHALIELLNA